MSRRTVITIAAPADREPTDAEPIIVAIKGLPEVEFPAELPSDIEVIVARHLMTGADITAEDGIKVICGLFSDEAIATWSRAGFNILAPANAKRLASVTAALVAEYQRRALAVT